jgi:hypothetical protein
VVNPLAIWKIILISIIAFVLLTSAIGGIFRIREKRKARAFAAAAEANGEVPKEVVEASSYANGQLDQYGNMIRPAVPADVHLRDEAGNVPLAVNTVAGPTVR